MKARTNGTWVNAKLVKPKKQMDNVLCICKDKYNPMCNDRINHKEVELKYENRSWCDADTGEKIDPRIILLWWKELD